MYTPPAVILRRSKLRRWRQAAGGRAVGRWRALALSGRVVGGRWSDACIMHSIASDGVQGGAFAAWRHHVDVFFVVDRPIQLSLWLRWGLRCQRRYVCLARYVVYIGGSTVYACEGAGHSPSLRKLLRWAAELTRLNHVCVGRTWQRAMRWQVDDGMKFALSVQQVSCSDCATGKRITL